MGTRGAQRTLWAYDGLTVGVQTHRETDAEWLAEMLVPAFSRGSGGPADLEVELRVDPERFAELQARGPAAPGELVAGAVLDDSTERFERWTRGPHSGEAGPEQIAFDPQFRTFHEVWPGVRVRLTAGGGEFGRLALMRVVRELAMQASLRRGSVFLHAAAFGVSAGAIVVAGEKGAGKTTTLSWSLSLLEEARFLANDRVRLHASSRDPAAFTARAMPTVLSFRPASLALLPALEARLRGERGMAFHSRSEARDRDDLGPLAPFPDGRIGLKPTRYGELLGRGTEAEAEVAAIVFPELAGDPGGLRARRLAPAEAAPRLVGALFGAADPGRRSELYALPRAGPFPTAAELRERAGRIAARVPAWTWRVGESAPRDAAGLRAFLRELSLGPRS